MTTDLSPADINLADPDFFRTGDVHRAWTVLRREAPVHWNPGSDGIPGFWSITRYHDVLAISRDPETFISGRGIAMFTNPEDPELAAGFGKSMITTDPPRHVRLRRLVNKGFTPRQVAALEPAVREVVTAILDEIAGRGECDFVTDVAAELPLAVICDMMGVPRSDARYMFELTNRTLGSDDPEYQTAAGDARNTMVAARGEMFQYFAKLVEERRGQRRDDLISVLVDADIDGDRLTDEEILFFCFLLIVAGNETTRNAISGGLLALLQHPDQLERLRADTQVVMPTAVEEIVRWTSPVMHMVRTATRDVEIRDTPIKAGERVIMWYPSANRDEEVFKAPFEFDVTRNPNEHLAFGIGEHFCLGAGLARLEIRVMFEELFRRLRDIELASDPERLRSTFIGGIKHMPIRFTSGN